MELSEGVTSHRRQSTLDSAYGLLRSAFVFGCGGGKRTSKCAPKDQFTRRNEFFWCGCLCDGEFGGVDVLHFQIRGCLCLYAVGS